MARTFKILSALLSYPTEELTAAVQDFPAILAGEQMLDPPHVDGIARLAGELRDGDLLDLQERYVELFDRSRSLSLHLFEHVHGESRDRGQAMVDLKSLYEQHGLTAGSAELPDYLPLFLEFLSMLPKDEALELLAQPAHVLAALAGRLGKRESGYAAVLAALAALGGAERAAPPSEEPEDNPNDFAALDAAWESEAVSFGPGAGQGGCPKVSGMLEKLGRPAAGGGSNG